MRDILARPAAQAASIMHDHPAMPDGPRSTHALEVSKCWLDPRRSDARPVHEERRLLQPSHLHRPPNFESVRTRAQRTAQSCTPQSMNNSGCSLGPSGSLVWATCGRDVAL